MKTKYWIGVGFVSFIALLYLLYGWTSIGTVKGQIFAFVETDILSLPQTALILLGIIIIALVVIIYKIKWK